MVFFSSSVPCDLSHLACSRPSVLCDINDSDTNVPTYGDAKRFSVFSFIHLYIVFWNTNVKNLNTVELKFRFRTTCLTGERMANSMLVSSVSGCKQRLTDQVNYGLWACFTLRDNTGFCFTNSLCHRSAQSRYFLASESAEERSSAREGLVNRVLCSVACKDLLMPGANSLRLLDWMPLFQYK